MKKIYDQSIKLHKCCLNIPGLSFMYEKRKEGYLFIASDPEDFKEEKDDVFLAQGIIPFKYYNEVSRKIKKESPDSWVEVADMDFEEDF
ncbi:hypothetical protein ES703_12643 [subsurface metagenome]